jgi:hypothetical protein
MPDPVLHRFLERGAGGGFANVTLASGECIFISLAPTGIRIHRAMFFGRLPGRTLHAANAAALTRATQVIARSIGDLPKLPNSAAMDSFLTVAAASLVRPGSITGGLVDEDAFPMTQLQVVTRLTLASGDAGDLVRRLTRAANTP